MPLFTEPMHEQFASWATGYITADGADFGELEAIAAGRTGDDDGAFYDAFMGAANRHLDAARDADQRGKRHTAIHHYLRTAVYASVGYKPLFGTPVDPRLRVAFDVEMDAFERAMALLDPPAEHLAVQLDGNPMTVVFLHGAGGGAARRPAVIMNNGYDAAVPDMYLAMARAALARGYHCVLVDGPGEGAMLVRQGVPMIPDWERVIGAVIDVVAARPDVDADRIALQGWSLGGHLALRAASGDPRLAACVLDPPLWSMLAGVLPLAKRLGLGDDAVARFPEISDEDQAKMTAALEQVPQLRWAVLRRGFWVNGVSDLRGYLGAVAEFTLDGRSDGVRCPVLGAAAEHDPLAQGAADALGRLHAPTTLVRFTAEQGAADHCEMQNRALAETIILDWLDDTLGSGQDQLLGETGADSIDRRDGAPGDVVAGGHGQNSVVGDPGDSVTQ